MNQVPIFIHLLFVVTTFLTVWMFYKASGKSKTALVIILAWVVLQAIIGITGFYQDNNSIPPRFALLIVPAIILIFFLFLTKRGRAFIDGLDLRILTLLHTVRIPVEITLYFLYTSALVPKLMTFEGSNFDILSGITAPIIFYFVFYSKKAGITTLLIWNFLCLALLINIVVIAILSAQTPFQKLAFDQPNIGVTIFPFVWLPCVIVPLVLFSHLVAIRQLTKKNICR